MGQTQNYEFPCYIFLFLPLLKGGLCVYGKTYIKSIARNKTISRLGELRIKAELELSKFISEKFYQNLIYLSLK